MIASRPTLQNLGGIYQLEFKDERLSVQVDRITESTKYETSGEIAIKCHIPGFSSHIHQARLNLTSSSARKSMSKFLEERIPSLDWTGILEFVCVMVLKKHREGMPAIKLADHSMPEGLLHRLFPYLQERQSTVIFGEGDTGKSWLATLMAVLVSMGMPRLGMEAEPGNVLYLDYETDEDTLLERVDMISSGLDIDIPDGIYYRQMHQLFAADFQQINKLVVDNNIALVIVDSAAPAVGEPESSAPTTEYFRALRSLRKSTLTIAHVSKAGKENEPFGSIFWRNLPRANFRVNASHEPGASQFVIGLKHTKSNNGRRLRDRAYETTFSEGAVTFDHAAITDFPDLAKGLSHGQRISAALHNGAKSVKELAETLEISEASVRTTLNRHKDELYAVTENAGGIIRWGNMYYGETP